MRTLSLTSSLLAVVAATAWGKEPTMKIASPAFTHMGAIPSQHTCEGKDVSPELAWTGAPEGTKSFALIVDDPDAPDPKAPQRTWVHWVVYDIPPTASLLPENAKGKLPEGTLEGRNDWKQMGWRGPCPPIGRHRYFFKLYALDTTLPDLKGPIKAQVEAAMHGHVLASTELVGTYKKK